MEQKPPELTGSETRRLTTGKLYSKLASTCPHNQYSMCFSLYLAEIIKYVRFAQSVVAQSMQCWRSITATGIFNGNYLQSDQKGFRAAIFHSIEFAFVWIQHRNRLTQSDSRHFPTPQIIE